ncbi:MAG: hypothetical protein LBL93_06765 [Ruminococcus sp.]|jgi:hypothetical protein|nr:hypothetical protein [Ruminococcus sp.]
MNIKMPTEEEKKKSIQAIIDMALPEKPTVYAEIKRLFKAVGLKYAFCGVADAVLAAVLVSLCFAIPASIYGAVEIINPEDSVISFLPILFLSPILYLSILFFTAWKEYLTGTLDVLTSCRYNLKYITAVRVIIVSAAGIGFLLVTTLPMIGTIMYPKIVLLCFSAMFLYSSLSLLFLFFSESHFVQFAMPVLWATFWSVSCIVFTPQKVEIFLSGIPVSAILLVLALLITAYILELRVLVLRATCGIPTATA